MAIATPVYFGFALVIGFSADAFSSRRSLPVHLAGVIYRTFHATVWVWLGRAAASSRALVGAVGHRRVLLVGYVYYELCKTVGMFIAWNFLVGFPFTFPLTLLVVRATVRQLVVVWTLLPFAAFFWSCQGLLWWKAAE